MINLNPPWSPHPSVGFRGVHPVTRRIVVCVWDRDEDGGLKPPRFWQDGRWSSEDGYRQYIAGEWLELPRRCFEEGIERPLPPGEKVTLEAVRAFYARLDERR